jgi:hypothetical protein
MVDRDEWTGTVTELMSKLKELDRTEALMARERGAVTTRRDWPPDATRFSGRIRAVAATLRKAGIDVAFGTTRRHNQSRFLTLRKSNAGDAVSPGDAGDTVSAEKPKKPRKPKKSIATADT